MKITIFPSVKAGKLQAKEMAWPEIVALCRNPKTHQSKQACPLLKLASFGDTRTADGCLRHNANVLSISGIEGDYDGGIIQPEDAASMLELVAGIEAVIYTSPSHTPSKPRWRVLAPLSGECLPDYRRELVGRLNGVLGGILAKESFTLSQTYYFGRVSGVDYAVHTSTGAFLDKVDGIAPVYPSEAVHTTPARHKRTVAATPELLEDLRSALTVIPADEYTDWIAVGEALSELGEEGFLLWEEWSRESANFTEEGLEKWEGFSHDRTGFTAVFAKAQRLGWVNPKASCGQSQADTENIQRLAALAPFEYDRVRTDEAAAMGVRAGTLDAMVKEVRTDVTEAGRFPFAEVEPYPHPVQPAQLLNEVSDTIQRFIVLDTEQAHAAALWVALTWFIDVVQVAPLAIINAPEKSCGKTQLLTVIGHMAYRPLPASNASASALFRAVELWKPTILIDEADTFFRDNAELAGMVNAGYLRGGFVLRSEAVGDTFEPRMFSVFSAKAIAGIALEKHLADATMSRGIVLNLRRKLSGESVSRLRHADRDSFSALAEKLARFAADYSQQMRQARPLLPDALSDRDQDNWEGLLAVASCAGAEWVGRATAAALKLSGAGDKSVSIGNELLQDIQHVFEAKRLSKISTAELIAALCADEELSWNTYNKGRQLSSKQLAKRLKEYGINSKQMRFNAIDNPVRGFELSQFNDAFLRYLAAPPNLPVHVTKSPEANNGGVFSVTDS